MKEIINKIKRNKKRYCIISILSFILIAATFIYFNHFREPDIQVPPDGILQIKSVNNNIIILGNFCGQDLVNKEADFIIEGTIEKLEESWNIDYTSHTINAEFCPEKFIRGRSFDVKKINILDIMSFDNEDYRDDFYENPDHWLKKIRPNFKEGERVRLYLVISPQGDLNIICGNYGVEKI